MPDAIIVELAGFGLDPHRIGKAEIGMTDHAEHAGHAPIYHSLDHHIGDGTRALWCGWQADIDAILAHLDRKGLLP